MKTIILAVDHNNFILFVFILVEFSELFDLSDCLKQSFLFEITFKLRLGAQWSSLTFFYLLNLMLEFHSYIGLYYSVFVAFAPRQIESYVILWWFYCSSIALQYASVNMQETSCLEVKFLPYLMSFLSCFAASLIETELHLFIYY